MMEYFALFLLVSSALFLFPALGMQKGWGVAAFVSLFVNNGWVAAVTAVLLLAATANFDDARWIGLVLVMELAWLILLFRRGGRSFVTNPYLFWFGSFINGLVGWGFLAMILSGGWDGGYYLFLGAFYLTFEYLVEGRELIWIFGSLVVILILGKRLFKKG